MCLANKLFTDINIPDKYVFERTTYIDKGVLYE